MKTTRKTKEPTRREGWHYVEDSSGKQKWKTTVDLDWDGMTFDDLVAEMDRIKEEFGSQFDKFKLVSEEEHLPYDEPRMKTFIKGWRKETDEEFQARIDADAQLKALLESRERAEFERLAKKFK